MKGRRMVEINDALGRQGSHVLLAVLGAIWLTKEHPGRDTRTGDNGVSRPTGLPSLSPGLASTVLSRSLVGKQGLPELPLFLPVYDQRQPLELTQVNGVAAPLGPR